MGTSASKDGGGSDAPKGYRYSIGYAPTGAALCRECKTKIEKGSLRIGRSMPNPFTKGADSGKKSAEFTQFFHFDHAFATFGRSRGTSKVPTTASVFSGLADISPADRRNVRHATAAFAAEWKQTNK
jgi:DNA ligase-3